MGDCLAASRRPGQGACMHCILVEGGNFVAAACTTATRGRVEGIAPASAKLENFFIACTAPLHQTCCRLAIRRWRPHVQVLLVVKSAFALSVRRHDGTEAAATLGAAASVCGAYWPSLACAQLEAARSSTAPAAARLCAPLCPWQKLLSVRSVMSDHGSFGPRSAARHVA